MLTSVYVHVKHVRTFPDVMREYVRSYRQRTVSTSGFVLLSSVIIDNAMVSLLLYENGIVAPKFAKRGVPRPPWSYFPSFLR